MMRSDKLIEIDWEFRSLDYEFRLAVDRNTAPLLPALACFA
jgi:hypothetical protein